MCRLTPPKSWGSGAIHLRAALEHPWYRTVSRLLSEVVLATFDFYSMRGFRPVLMPVTSGAITSPIGKASDSLPVAIELFGAKTYLADSMQFYLEFFLRQGGDGVFYVMPTFRGEAPDETHLNQFFHSEAEILGSLAVVIELVNAYLHHCTAWILARCEKDVHQAAGTTLHLEEFLHLGRKVLQLDVADARTLLKGNPEHFIRLADGIEVISRAGEKALLAAHPPCLWLCHPEHSTVPFYQAKHHDGIHALSADFLLGVGEIVGCGQRHTDAESVALALAEHKVDPRAYDWYLSMKQSHPLLTAGFGLGLERYLLWILCHDDIRDLQIIPRLKSDCGSF
jgi:asparaginyl-tRNA synthetase